MCKLTIERAKELNPLVLAFVGDSYYTLYVRTQLASNFDYKANMLNRKANKFVCAAGQARHLELILPLLSAEEADIARRARNAHSNTSAKNASAVDYKRATALEAIFGYLALTGQQDRCEYLMNIINFLE